MLAGGVCYLLLHLAVLFFFFFQAEDGIRDVAVTGVQTCALPIFREFLRVYPAHDRAPDALFYVGETFAGESADSAAAVYQQVVKTYPNSSRAPSALYKLGLLAEQRGDKAAARTYYARVIAGYPRSDEANLARDKLQRLGR